MKKIIAWTSERGKVYTNPEECAKEDGLVLCYICKGSGEEKYQITIPYPSWLPDSGWVEETTETRTRTCTRCTGIGYVSCNKEDKPEYQEYLKLKNKYEGK